MDLNLLTWNFNYHARHIPQKRKNNFNISRSCSTIETEARKLQ